MDNELFASKIDALQKQIDDLMQERLIKLVRNALQENPKLNYFCNAMGTAFFVSSETTYSGKAIHYKPEEICNELGDFYLEFDDRYKITGEYPMCIYRERIITEW